VGREPVGYVALPDSTVFSFPFFSIGETKSMPGRWTVVATLAAEHRPLRIRRLYA
jgi:hypothetical protein